MPTVSHSARDGGHASLCPPCNSRVPVGQISPASISGGVQNVAKSAARRTEFHEPFQRDLGRPACGSKIIRFTFPGNGALLAPSRLMKRGVRVVTIRGVRVAVDTMALRAREVAGRRKP